MLNAIQNYWEELRDLAATMPAAQLERMADMLLDCYSREGTVFVLGNGGSAATASHFACDLAKGTRNEYVPAFRVVPLTDNMPLVTAWANDTRFEKIFSEQLRALARPGDVVVMISASGNSPNVLAAGRVAQEMGAVTIGLTGRKGGKLKGMCDLSLCAPSDVIELVEDAHIAVCHSVCVALRGKLQGVGAVRQAQALVEEVAADAV